VSERARIVPRTIGSLLVADRGEIAIRIIRAARELGLRTVAIFSEEDRAARHRFTAHESYRVGAGRAPIDAYLDLNDILRVARRARVDAIHPGYGFLASKPELADACVEAGIAFVGPSAEVLRALGDKIAARALAQAVGLPVMPATPALPHDHARASALAAAVGYPLIVKASRGGGGRGLRVVDSPAELPELIETARRESRAAFGEDLVYAEKVLRRARHVEIQILGDLHGNLVHLFERDCSIQRRHQKIVEWAPAPSLSEGERRALCEAALTLARAARYTHAGTVEFLLDADTRAFYFIEVNPRLQVEHTVTEEVTGIDIVKAQLRIAAGARIGGPASGVPSQEAITVSGHALQCRVTTEDPARGFAPAHGRLTTCQIPAGPGIRVDAGSAHTGAVVSPFYDSLLMKIIVRGDSPDEAIGRMARALGETRVGGVASNLEFLDRVITHPALAAGKCATTFVDETPELFEPAPAPDRTRGLLEFVGAVTVNGNPEMLGRPRPAGPLPRAPVPGYDADRPIPPGSRDRLRELGPERFLAWMRREKRVHFTDTTVRDAQQSLLATRVRTHDILAIAPAYARLAPQLFSLECWGGATFDVMLRFLREDPWERLARLRAAVPNLLLQMMVRASNAVGYTSYPDNVVQHFITQAAREGIDLFRVFDSLNGVDNMRVAIDAVRGSGALCEAAMCYTGDLFDAARPKWNLRYYVDLARQLEKAGAQILGIKDMAGVCRPRAARALVEALRNEVGVPIHFDTHDTSGIAAASVLAAIDAGADAVYGALDAMSGLTSQPNLSAMASALAGSELDPGLDPETLQSLSRYWEVVRRYYAPFEADMRAGTADVYRHEMPGPQYTNLRAQARGMGLEHRWDEICQRYAEVNLLFGDLVKITPTSTAVADMALCMVANGLSRDDVLDPGRDLAFPKSVVALFRGEVGAPPEGFPADLQRKVLKGQPVIYGRAAAQLPAADLGGKRRELETFLRRPVSDRDLSSWLLFPSLFLEYARHRDRFGDVSVLPTTAFLYGLREGEEIEIEVAPGRRHVIALLARTEPDAGGFVTLFATVDGQLQLLELATPAATIQGARAQAQDGNPSHVSAGLAGTVVAVAVRAGQVVARGETLLAIEAMKMETHIIAERDALVTEVYVAPGDAVGPRDLLILLS
jgi:pyruvate carboxylase